MKNFPSKGLDAPEGGRGWSFCSGHGIFIASGLECRNAANRGTGVYAIHKIAKGQRLMHVPTAALFTTSSIPDNFLTTKARKGVAVHALLAAYLTFAPLDGALLDYSPWMARWPRLSDFTTHMPLSWPEKCRNARFTSVTHKTTKPSASREGVKSSFAILPSPITGSWLLPSAMDESTPGGSTSLVPQQLKKLHSQLDSVARLLPQHASSLRDPQGPTYWRFIHNWCCVNTRCFYYVAPGQKRPDDPNEAMALCPGMDMFNHTDDIGCETRYDRTGYSVIADRDYAAGEEILLSYGAHTNDVLWAEYGFVLDGNEDDAIRIDKLVLDSLDNKQKDLLADYGYLGEYWLRSDGVCWRTEAVAWMRCLTEDQFVRMVQEGWDPAEVEQGSQQVKRNLGGARGAVHRETRTKEVKKRVVEWIVEAKEEAEASLRGLNEMPDEDVLVAFGDDAAIMEAQGAAEVEIEAARNKQASERKDMCLKRWRQIWELCMSALRSIEDGCEGAFVTEQPGGLQEDLDATFEDVFGV